MQTLARQSAPSLGKRLFRAYLASVLPARAWRELNAGIPILAGNPIFSGAQTGRLFADWVTSLLHPDEELKGNIRLLRARGRDLYRNDALAKRFGELLQINVIGPNGPTLAAQVRDSKGQKAAGVNAQIEEAWYRWAGGPVTVDEQLDLVGLQQLLVLTVAVDGEAFLRIRRRTDGFGFALEPVDADQVDDTMNRLPTADQNEIRLGIEIDPTGKRVAYHIADRPLTLGIGPRKIERVPAADIIHLYLPFRVNQTRGVTWYSAAIWPIKQHGGHTESELVASRISSAKMGFYFTKPDEGGFGADPSGNDDGTGDDKGGFQQQVEPGMLSILPPGYQFQPFDPQHPTTAFEAFTRAIVRRIASALGMSYESISNDRTGSSYSSERSALIVEHDGMRRIQGWWNFKFFNRLYPEWMNGALLTGELKLPSRDASRYLACSWTPRGWNSVDEFSDVKAAAVAIHNGLASRKTYLAQRGLGVEEVFEDLAEEQRLAKEKGIQLATNVSLSALNETTAAPAAGTEGDGETTGAPSKPRAAVLDALNGNGHRGRGLVHLEANE